jgi:hypothetical protein
MPAGALKALLLVTFALHLMAVNLAVGGSLVLACHALRGRLQDRELLRRLAPVLPPALTFTITLGVAPLLFLQLLYGPFFYTASVLSAFPWLSMLALVMVGYVLLYGFVVSSATPAPRPGTGLLASLLLLGVGLMLVNVTTLSLRPDLWATHAASSIHGLRMNTADPTLWPRFLHMVASMVAVAGLCLAAWGAWRREDFARRAGLRWFIGATLSQLAWGPWLLLTQPPAVLEPLLAGTSGASLSLWGSMACGLLALVMALPASQEGSEPGTVWPVLVLALASVLGMILLRDQARDLSLGAFGFQVGALPHHTDWLSLGVFGLTLVGLVALLVTLLRWAGQPATKGGGA